MFLVVFVFVQDDLFGNVFFGFDFVFVLIVIKWVCGGEVEEDLLCIDVVVMVFFEDVEVVQMECIVIDLKKVQIGEVKFVQIMGVLLNSDQEE